MTQPVRANGGVIWRESDQCGDSTESAGFADSVEILIAHRPRYDDWSLPKGKLEPGETDGQCALREAEEETGFRCALGPELSAAEYVDASGRSKRVRYWAMTPLSGGFAPNSEVDAVRWLAPDAAQRLLTYETDRLVVNSFLEEYRSRSSA